MSKRRSRGLPAIICYFSANEPGGVLGYCKYEPVLFLGCSNHMIPQLLVHICVCLCPKFRTLAWWVVAVVEEALHQMEFCERCQR